MSWHCVSVRGAKGDATPYCLASPSTCFSYAAVSALLAVALNGDSLAIASRKFAAAESSLVTGPTAPPRPPRPPPRPPPPAPRPPAGAAPHGLATGAAPRPPPRPPFGLTLKARASESTLAVQAAVSAAVAEAVSGVIIARAALKRAIALFAAVSAGDTPCD